MSETVHIIMQGNCGDLGDCYAVVTVDGKEIYLPRDEHPKGGIASWSIPEGLPPGAIITGRFEWREQKPE